MAIKNIKIIRNIMVFIMLLIIILRTFLKSLLTAKIYYFSIYIGIFALLSFIILELVIYLKKNEK